jgi:hypothetical protein
MAFLRQAQILPGETVEEARSIRSKSVHNEAQQRQDIVSSSFPKNTIYLVSYF